MSMHRGMRAIIAMANAIIKMYKPKRPIEVVLDIETYCALAREVSTIKGEENNVPSNILVNVAGCTVIVKSAYVPLSERRRRPR